ncbi:MAG: hypothetical protein AB1942_00755 [Pseudomonadota bacterium]
MSWMAYCWREAFECEKLARVHEGRARQEWLEAADHWFHESADAASSPPRAATRPQPAPVLSL